MTYYIFKQRKNGGDYDLFEQAPDTEGVMKLISTEETQKRDIFKWLIIKGKQIELDRHLSIIEEKP